MYAFFIVTAAIWGIIMSILIPVTQIPDEENHFKQMMVAYGTPVYFDETYGYIEEVGFDEFDFGDYMKVDGPSYERGKNLKYEHKLSLGDFHIKLQAVKYLPAAVGFYLAAAIRLPIYICLRFAELFSLLFYIIVGFFALKAAPYKKEIFLFALLMPMAIQEAGSFSPDAIVIPGCIFLTAMILNFKERETKVKWKDVLAFLLITFMVTIAKEVYFFMILGLLIVPLDQFELKIGKKIELGSLFKKYRIIWIILILACGGVGVFVMRNSLYLRILQACMLQPGRFLLLFRVSVSAFSFYYEHTMIGAFGWLDTFVSTNYLNLYLIMLFYLILVHKKSETESLGRLKAIHRIILLTVAFGVIVLVFMSMVCATYEIYQFDLGAGVDEFRQNLYKIESIQGVQGRYFIPVIPMAAIALSGEYEIRREKVSKAVQYLYYVVSVIYTLRLINARFW